MASYKQASKGPKRPANRMPPVVPGERRRQAVDDIVDRVQKGNADSLREEHVVRR